MSNGKLLSICIPTCNRAELLKKTIDSIVNDLSFDDSRVELIVSDNNSTDNTEEIVKFYIKDYKNISFYKNKKNNGFMNIITALNYADGEFCKLQNDYSMFKDGTVKTLLEIAQKNIDTKPQIYFSNGLYKSSKKEIYNSFNSFLFSISYWCTFLGGFSIWREDYMKSQNIEINKMFPHTTFLLDITSKDKYILNNNKLFEQQEVKKKGGYNIFDVFGVQFLDLLSKNLVEGEITQKTFNKIKQDLKIDFFIQWYYNTVVKNTNHSFHTEDIKIHLLKYYSNFDYYLIIIMGRFYPVRLLLKKVINIVTQKIRSLYDFKNKK